MPDDWRGRAIPKRLHAPTARSYAHIPVDLSDPRNAEPLVKLADYGIAGGDYYARDDGNNPPYYRRFPAADAHVWSRRQVAERLQAVNAGLKPYGAELLALNGYRPVALQRQLWDFFLHQADIELDNPSERQRIAVAGKYCSDPSHFDPADSRTWPTHATGGAIDLTLRAIATAEPLFMGGVFDDPDPVSHTGFFERKLVAHGGDMRLLSASAREALRNRRLLHWAMIGEGFAGYAYEWWHFDWGTQMWVVDIAAGEGERPGAAFYGPAELPG